MPLFRQDNDSYPSLIISYPNQTPFLTLGSCVSWERVQLCPTPVPSHYARQDPGDLRARCTKDPPLPTSTPYGVKRSTIATSVLPTEPPSMSTLPSARTTACAAARPAAIGAPAIHVFVAGS